MQGTNLTGTLATAAQPNVTSLGTLSSLNVSGNVLGTAGTFSSISIAGAVAATQADATALAIALGG